MFIIIVFLKIIYYTHKLTYDLITFMIREGSDKKNDKRGEQALQGIGKKVKSWVTKGLVAQWYDIFPLGGRLRVRSHL